jgi:hypothetical protein
MTVDLVRDCADVVRLLDPADDLLLVADGLICSLTAWRAIHGATAPSLLTTDDIPATQTLEQLDAATRWAGLALIPAATRTVLADAPVDWDPQLFLFRHAVQHGAARIHCDPRLFLSGDFVVADAVAAAKEVEHRLLDEPAQQSVGLADRFVIDPLIRVVSGPLLRQQRSGMIARGVTMAATLAAAACAAAGWIWPAAAAGIVAAFSARAADFVAQFRPEPSLWVRVALAGWGAQILALAVADRGLSGENGAIGWGSGALMVPLLIIVAQIMKPALLNRSRFTLDIAAAWALAAVLVPVLGWRSGFDLIGSIGGIVLIAALLRWRRGVDADDGARSEV